MITDSFDNVSQPMISPGDVGYTSGRFFDICICTFSENIVSELISNRSYRQVAELRCVNGSMPIYSIDLEGKSVGVAKIHVGSASAGADLIDINYTTGAVKFIVFGSAGCLDSSAVSGRYIIPTAAYRDEGLSYHYAPPSDYIAMPRSDRTAEIFASLGKPYVQGRVWTTDAFYRETRANMEKRVSEGCIAVDMEMAGLQAVCSFHGFELYAFLEAGDVLDGESYDVSGLHGANHDLAKARIALEIAKEI